MKVQVVEHNGRYRLRWNTGFDKPSLSLGLSVSKSSKAYADKLARTMEFDYGTRQWDGRKESAVEKYLPSKAVKTSTETTVELFDRYTAFKRKTKGLAESGIKSRYLPISKYLAKHLNKPAAKIGRPDAESFAEALEFAQLSSQTIKERLWMLQSCWQWAEISPNPWQGLTDRFKTSPKQKVKPFTLDELRLIVKTFYDHPDYSHYADFVRFQCNYPMRPGEAAGLLWKHVADDFSWVWIGESVTRGVRRSTKNNKARTIKLSTGISAMLRDRHAKLNPKPKPDDLVFPSPKGKPIEDTNFSSRAWKTILTITGIEYRKLYAIRHSVLSHGANKGSSFVSMADAAGHDTRVLLSTYAHAIDKSDLFEGI